ncbi:MAG TPA: glycosyltransferase [Chitinivibrionales bacterium]|nr:glycosyltransferase [Chitinivibrionales bacterium]
MIVSKPIPRMPYDVCIVHLADARYYPFFHRQASALTEKGYRVAFVSWENRRGEGNPAWPGIDVFPITIPAKAIRGKFFFVRYFFSLAIVLLRLKARLYEAVDPPALVPVRIAAGFNRSRYNYFSLEYFQGVDQLVGKPVMRRVWLLLERFGVRRARNVAAVCNSTERLLQKDFGIPHTATILNVPNRSEYAAPPDGRLRRRLCIGSDTPLVIYKGEIAENRGLLPLVRAMEPLSPLHFALVGAGGYREHLAAEAARLGLSARVHFVDPVKSDEFVYYLKDADLGQVIHETRGLNMTITLPSKLFDYVNAGIPVIASDGPEISRIVREFKLGWVVSPSSVESIREALAGFLSAFPDLAAYKKNCLAAAEKFCWENEKKVYLDFMEEAMEGSKA